jgi:hypothetical protein
MVFSNLLGEELERHGDKRSSDNNEDTGEEVVVSEWL